MPFDNAVRQRRLTLPFDIAVWSQLRTHTLFLLMSFIRQYECPAFDMRLDYRLSTHNIIFCYSPFQVVQQLHKTKLKLRQETFVLDNYKLLLISGYVHVIPLDSVKSL